MLRFKNGSYALYPALFALFFLAMASADDEQIQLAQPDFAIYHTKYVMRPQYKRQLLKRKFASKNPGVCLLSYLGCL